jgi:site-specific DNA recombinase
MAMKIRKQNPKATAQAAPLPLFTALYIRVSTEKQADEGFSLEAQESRLQSYCDAQGWTVDSAHVYIDAGISGKSTDRPAFSAMMQAAQDGKIARIVSIKLDRLARNTKDFLGTVEKLQAFGCDLVLLKESFDTGTPHGKFALTMFAAIAELEASQIAERTMSGRKQKAAQGGDNGRYCPLGYTFDNGYSVDESAADTVRSIFRDYTAGDALTAIASRLNVQDAPTARGGKWYPATVRYILTNGFYAGLTQYDGQSVAGDHPAIIDADTYNAAITILRK